MPQPVGGMKLAAMNSECRFYSLGYFFANARRVGYDACELWLGPMHLFVNHEGHDPLDEVRALSERYGVEVIGVCPEQCNPKPYYMAARGAMRERSMAYLRQAIDIACDLGAHQVVTSSGWGYLDEGRAAAWGRSVTSLREVCAYAERRGMTVAVEALQAEESNLANTADDLARLLDDVDSPALKVCLDTGAMWAAGETIDDYFRTLGSAIVHCHFVDCGTWSHVAWGEGTRDMGCDLASLAACGYRGYLTVETVDEGHFGDPAGADARAMEIFSSAAKELDL